MTDTPGNIQLRTRRPTQIVLAVALALYGIAGFPHPGEPDPSPAAAHPLPGFPHSHGANPVCGGLTCPPPGDGTGERPHGGQPGTGPGGGRPGDSRPSSNCVGAHAAGCRKAVEQGYIDPDDDLNEAIDSPRDIADMGDTFAEANPSVDFDADDFADAMDKAERPPNRGDVANALCAAVSGCSSTGDEAIQYLLDNHISFGQDDDTVEGFNPANPVTIGQMGSFFNRIPESQDNGGGGGGGPGGGGASPPGGGGDDEEPCPTGLGLTAGDRSRFVSQLQWVTLVGIEVQGEPGRPWPPHPDMPGGSEFLVVSESPVWPVIDADAPWHVHSDDGCRWEAVSVQTRMTQLLPWRTSDRSTIESAHAARPGAGFGTYLRRWDNLSASQQTQAQQYHTGRDVSASCGIATAMVAADSYGQCRWELPRPGVWSWQARACFEGVTEDATFFECATLASGVEWFLEIIDYTSGITLQHNSGALPEAGPRPQALEI
ncbi:MAG: hypothetical protein J4F50_08580 [Acidimicrobiia bacterium]|nr:hypothetical protein [Acidimicrobiia bacterium]